MYYYFFDDSRIYRRMQTERVYGRPRYVGEFAKGTTTGAPACIIQGSPLAPYAMYYHKRTQADGKAYMALSLAVSDDCIHWHDLPNDVEIPGKQFENQVLDTGLYECLTAVYTPDTPHKYRLYVADWVWGGDYKIKMTMYVSDDGVHFEPRETSLTPYPTEPFCASYYNDLKGVHTFLLRPDWGERRTAIVETADFEHYTEPRFLLQPDSEDPAHSELYGNTVCRADDLFVGLMHLYHTGSELEFRYNQKMRKGHLEMQLIYSYDGVTFQRSLRRPFLDRGMPSDSDWYGLVFGYGLNKREDDYVMTAITSPCEHGYFVTDGAMKISSFTIKKGRFCGLRSYGGDASVMMRAMVYNGGDISVNIEVPYGEARARLMDRNKQTIEGFGFEDCEPFTGDSLCWKPKWKRPLSELKGELFTIELTWHNGILWSLEGDLDIMYSFPVTERYANYGIRPKKIIY